MELDQALKYAIDGEALLFIGSGFSVGATSIGGKDFLTGRALAKYLYAQAGIVTDDDQLNYAAETYERTLGPERLLAELKEVCTATKLSALQLRIPEVPWKAIFTTNYDNIIEKSYEFSKQRALPITPKDDTKVFTSAKRSCVHINGFVPKSDVQDLYNNIKLTNSSYLTEAFASSHWGFLFRKSIETAKAVIFIGYSMYDLDIQRIVHNTVPNQQKTIFIERDDLDPGVVATGIQSNFGTVYPIGLNGFFNRFDIIKQQHSPVDGGITFFNFKDIKIDVEQRELRDSDVFDLLFKGSVDLHHVSNSLSDSDSPSYFIKRDVHDVVLRAIDAGTSNVIVHSDMANGKTLFIHGLSCSLINRGFRVFWLEREGQDLHEDLDNIIKVGGKIALVFENITRHVEDVKFLKLKYADSIVVIGSTKSVFFESSSASIRDALLGEEMLEIELDNLTATEIDSFCNLLSTYKFWGDLESLSQLDQHRFVAYDCNSTLSAVLLEIIKSPAIQKRFHELFLAMETDKKLVDILVTASVLTLLNFEVTDFFVSELTDSNYLYKPEFRRGENANELFNISSGKLVPKSSVLARFALTHHVDNKKLVDILIIIATRAHDRRGFSGFEALFFDIYKSMVTFSVLQAMLPEKGKRDALIRFYENMKNLEAAKNHPHFWLQYAIARLAYDDPEDLTRAKLYLDTAYAQAYKMGGNYHTRHMDNVSARYLMKHSIFVNDRQTCMADFRKAHLILIRQARSEKNEKAFRVARLYGDLYADRKGILTNDDKAEIRKASENIVEAMDYFKPTRSGRVLIDIVRKELAEIISST